MVRGAGPGNVSDRAFIDQMLGGDGYRQSLVGGDGYRQSLVGGDESVRLRFN
jgi:hypothetical protein